MGSLLLSVLVDNAGWKGFRSDWGWSILLERDNWLCLFDADTDPGVLSFNAARLGVDFSLLSCGFLSHFHFDHYGGYSVVGALRPGLVVWTPPGPVEVLARAGLAPRVVSGPAELADGVWSTGPLSAGGLLEHALAIEVEGLGLVVVVGCSHPGVDRLVEAAQRATGRRVYAVIGGFHGPSRKVLDRLAGLVDGVICPGHCSGYEAKRYLREHYPDKFCDVHTGLRVTISGGGVEVLD